MNQFAGLDADVQARRGLVLDVQLRVAAGERVALVGPNGAGKSTFVDSLAGLLPLDTGHVTLDGAVLDDGSRFTPSAQRAVGVLFQDLRLFNHLDARDNVAFGLRARGVRKAHARAIADDWLDRFSLANRARQPVALLSGGEAQRVALARALAIEPRLLVLDEPTAALDVQTKATTRRWLREHLAGLAIPQLLVTHDPIEAATFADRIAVLVDGRVVQEGTADELRRVPRDRYVADLLGGNLLAGRKIGGSVTLERGASLLVASECADGPVVVSVAPQGLSLHRDRPATSARNAWSTVVRSIADDGHRVRVALGLPIELVAEVTPAARYELALAPGTTIWVSCKATEIAVHPA